MVYSLTGLYVFRNVIRLGYFPLESILATEPMVDEILICYDPSSTDETEKLAKAVEKRFSDKTYLVPFVWPENVKGDGTRIGIASQYGLEHVRTSHVVNVQADEIWHPETVEWTRDNFARFADMGYDAFTFKVLNLEHNMFYYQGDDPLTRDPNDHRVSSWSWQNGAGYNSSEKLVKHCPQIKFMHDAWNFQGAVMPYRVELSQQFPIVHAHDNFRDSLLALRKNAAQQIWNENPMYEASASGLETTQERWYNSPIWTNADSPFMEWIHPIARPHLGKTHYEVNWSLLNDA